MITYEQALLVHQALEHSHAKADTPEAQERHERAKLIIGRLTANLLREKCDS